MDPISMKERVESDKLYQNIPGQCWDYDGPGDGDVFHLVNVTSTLKIVYYCVSMWIVVWKSHRITFSGITRSKYAKTYVRQILISTKMVVNRLVNNSTRHIYVVTSFSRYSHLSELWCRKERVDRDCLLFFQNGVRFLPHFNMLSGYQLTLKYCIQT